MNYQTISVSVDPRGVATLALNRPDKHNAMNNELIADVSDAIRQLNARSDVRVIVLTGVGKSFCAGGDLQWMAGTFEASRETRIKEATALAEMLRALNESNRPIIGRINGQAYGGGAGMMAVCDVTIAAASAKFCLTEARLGLTPATISTFVVAKMGAANARRCFLNSLPLNAQRAKELGLVDEVVADDELDDAVEREIDMFLQCGPMAVAKIKRLIAHVDSHDIENNIPYTAGVLADTWESDEGQEGIRCFFAKETPSWRTGV